ncbi:MAG: citrate transporter, partial [Nitrospirota bacterium]
MKKQALWILMVVLSISLSLFYRNSSFASEEIAKSETFYIAGTIIDSHEEPVKEARIKVLVNDKPQKVAIEHELKNETETSSHGTYQAVFNLPAGQIDNANI